MAYLPYDISSETTVDPTHIQANDAALDNAISGNLTETNFSSATRMPNSMLASPNVEELVELIFDINATKTVTNAVKVVIPVSGTGTYNVVDGRFSTFSLAGGVAAAGNSFVIEAGSWVAGVWTATSTISTVASWSASYTATQTALTITTGAFTAPTQLALRITANVTPPTSGTLSVTLRVTRALQ